MWAIGPVSAWSTQAIVHVSFMLLTAIAAGTQADLQFNPPRGVIIGVGIVDAGRVGRGGG